MGASLLKGIRFRAQHQGAQIADKALTPTASAHLNLVRGLAALLVAASHLRNLLFVDFPQVEHASILTRLAYVVTGLGHQAVMVFFVLSGYLVGGSSLHQMETGRWRWQSYAIARLTRLYSVLLPALVLCLFWDTLGIRLFGTDGIYGGHGNRFGVVGMVPERLGPGVVAANAAFLQTILAPSLGTNAPLWSLANEFWYYATFPFLAMAAVGRLAPYLRLILLAITAAMLAFTGASIALYMLVWLLGVVVYHLPRPDVLKSHRLAAAGAWVALVVLFLAVALSRILLKPGDTADMMLGGAVAIALYGVVALTGESRVGAYADIAGWLAEFSYTLYLVHLPFLVFLISWLNTGRLQPSMHAVALAAALFAATLAYARLVYVPFEGRTDRLRRWVSSRLDRPITRHS